MCIFKIPDILISIHFCTRHKKPLPTIDHPITDDTEQTLSALGGGSAEERKRKGGPEEGQDEEEEDDGERGRKSAFQTVWIYCCWQQYLAVVKS